MEAAIFKINNTIFDISDVGSLKIIEPEVFEDSYMIPTQVVYFSEGMAKELIKKLNEHYKIED